MKTHIRLFLTSGRNEVVGEQDPRASFLLASAGDEIDTRYQNMAAGFLASLESAPDPEEDPEDADGQDSSVTSPLGEGDEKEGDGEPESPSAAPEIHEPVHPVQPSSSTSRSRRRR